MYHKYSDGVTVAEIDALAYSVYESLLAHFARLGVEKRASTLKFLVPKSHPLTEIARRFGCTWTVRFPADRDGMWRVLNLVPLMRKLAVEFEARLKEAGLFGTRPIPGHHGRYRGVRERQPLREGRRARRRSRVPRWTATGFIGSANAGPAALGVPRHRRGPRNPRAYGLPGCAVAARPLSRGGRGPLVARPVLTSVSRWPWP